MLFYTSTLLGAIAIALGARWIINVLVGLVNEQPYFDCNDETETPTEHHKEHSA